MIDSRIFDLDERTELVVEFEYEPSEPATHDSAPSAPTFSIIGASIWQKNEQGYESVNILHLDGQYLHIDWASIEDEIFENLP